MTDDTPSPDPIADAWARARAVWEDIVLMFDTPQGLAELGWMIRADHQRLSAYLRALTALVQRLVLILALQLDVPQPKPRPPKPRVRHYRVYVRSYFARWPDTWDVSLPIPLTARTRAHTQRGASDQPTRSVLPLWSAAQRLEALRRLIEDPTPRARRLARLMARRRALQQNRSDRPAVLDLWRPPPNEETTPYLVFRIFLEIHALAEAAFARWRLEPG